MTDKQLERANELNSDICTITDNLYLINEYYSEEKVTEKSLVTIDVSVLSNRTSLRVFDISSEKFIKELITLTKEELERQLKEKQEEFNKL